LIFIDVLTDEVENHIDLFADDTTLYQYLQNDLETVESWAQKWLVLYNAKKNPCDVR
jgi:hypothetical protein